MGSKGKSITSLNVQTYQGMSLDDAADFVYNTPKVKDPEFNEHSMYQDVVNALDLHGKPIVLDDKSFDASVKDNALDGVVLYRGLGNQDDTRVADSIKFGDKFYVGSGYYGNGIYFTDIFDEAYKTYSNMDIKNSVLTAYIDKKKAKPIDYDAIYKQFASEPLMVQKKFAKADITKQTIFDAPEYLSSDALSQYALWKGYNVIVHQGNGHSGLHRIALTRDILVFRDTTPKGGVK